MILRRLGSDPHSGGAQTPCLRGCPDILELDSGDFAVIGRDITPEAMAHLPATVGCGPDERIVWIPRKTLVLAKGDIPNGVWALPCPFRVRYGTGSHKMGSRCFRPWR